MKHLKNFWVVYGSVVIAALSVFVPVIQQQIANHPSISGAMASVAVILAKISKSPAQS